MSDSEPLKLLAFRLGLRRRKRNLTLDVTYPSICFGPASSISRFCLELCDSQTGENGFVALQSAALADLSLCFQDAAAGSQELQYHSLLRGLLELGRPKTG